jgi:hypothetical protein
VLFDLRSGKRRRLVQVVYTLLAASFLIGFVLFGVGTGGIGSISDLFGGGGSSGSTSSAYDSQINHAKAVLKKDPQNQQALQNLARYELLAGQTGVTQSSDPTQPSTVSDDAAANFSAASDAWSRYLKVAKKPNPSLASQMATIYFQFLNDPNGAIRAQKIFADAQPSANTIGQLAIYEYAAGNMKAGDADAKQSVAKAPASSRKQIKSQLDQISKQAAKFFAAQKQAAKAAKASGSSQSPGASQLQNPFSGLSPSTTPTTP